MDNNYNRVELCGEVLETPQLSHINHNVSFFRFPLRVERLSGQADVLNIIASGELLAAQPADVGERVHITGQLRSFNNKSGVGSRLVLSVFARTMDAGAETPLNIIQLSGILCKPPTLRRTPLGRDICDVLLAVNRRYGRADYLPCIAWGAVAQDVASMHTGSRLTVEGRVQSRIYTKNDGAGLVRRTAYEVSIMRPALPEEFMS